MLMFIARNSIPSPPSRGTENVHVCVFCTRLSFVFGANVAVHVWNVDLSFLHVSFRFFVVPYVVVVVGTFCERN